MCYLKHNQWHALLAHNYSIFIYAHYVLHAKEHANKKL